MKRLLVLRHAKSCWKDDSLEDPERPLAKRGRRDAPRIGRLLAHEGLVPDLVVGSTALRARQTIDAVAAACAFRGELRLVPDLYPGEPEAVLGYLQRLDDAYERVLVVGHNPGLETLVGALARTEVTLPTAALAVLEPAVDRWSELDGHSEALLLRLWLPKELPADRP
jgi:phosphohistidine phosphatase